MPRAIDADFLRDIARQYEEHVASGERPGPKISAATGAPVATVHRWIRAARHRGMLAPTTPGVASGSAQNKQLGDAGHSVRQNVRILRQQRRLTFAELSRQLSALERPIPVLGLRRIETGTRRVDVDELVAFGAVFGVAPAALLEPLPGCATCHGAPPPGFICAQCNATTDSAGDPRHLD